MLGKISPLTEGELIELKEEFILQFKYNYNAIEGNTLSLLMGRRKDMGVYRSIPVRIMGAENEPPQPYMIAKNMEELISTHKQRKKKMHIIEVVSRFHL